MVSLSLLPLLFLSLIALHTPSNARIFTFEMHHRYSPHLKPWPQPNKGSFEYYTDLAARDRLLHRRKISETADDPLTFSDGNNTLRIRNLGFLHYATVSIGTPGKKFFVALDTGSDLFWVPCDCSRCASLEGLSFANDFEFSIYHPKDSNTSKNVPCDNSLCLHRSKCFGSVSHCPYVMSYVSSDTSTSGILVEDVLHLTTEDRHQESVEAYITFGCGQVQTGSFLDAAAPNGLLGLGMDNISVPSILSREGFTADSFSMCFGRDGVGRISFGDQGTLNQNETPFNMNPLHPTYSVIVTQIRVGTNTNSVEFSALFDTGTSFTYLVDPAYTKLSESFNSQVKDKRLPLDSRLPFEYCYVARPDLNVSSLPSVSLSMRGGRQFAVYDPIVTISTESEVVYCLAVVRSTELNILGQNFMTGYRIVFDREKYILGWQSSNCYDMDVLGTSAGDYATFVPPAVAAQPDNKTAVANRSSSRSSAASLAPSHSRQVLSSFSSLLCFWGILYFSRQSV